MRKTIIIWILLLISSCDQVDCTLYSTVSYTCALYADGSSVSLGDTLTITAMGTDSVLLNRADNVNAFSLPMSMAMQADTLVLHITGDGYSLYDTMQVEKTNDPHFESPDCPTRMFHTITRVLSTHNFIDSIVVTNPQVNYANVENIQIHFYPLD